MYRNTIPISVVIAARGRKEFLESAINSVINQSIDRKLYEIVVAKDFEDAYLDTLIEANNIKNVKYKTGDEATLLSAAVENSTGEVICILDDDDLFHQDKLKAVYSVFENDDIGYYHNSSYLIDAAGNRLEGSHGPELTESVEIAKNEEYGKILPKITQYDISFNSSSIAIRKKILEDYIDYVKKFRGNADRFLFFLALLSRTGIFIDHRKLTHYRVHKSVSNHFGSYSYFLQSKREYLKSLVKSTMTLQEMARNSPYKEMLEIELSEIKISLKMFDDEKSYPVKLGDYLRMLNTKIPGRAGHHLKLLVASFSHAVFPARTRKFLYRIYVKENQSVWN